MVNWDKTAGKLPLDHNEWSSEQWLGKTIGDGRYRLEEILGSGGEASVFRATDLVSEKEVAIKRFYNANNRDFDQGILDSFFTHSRQGFYETFGYKLNLLPDVLRIGREPWGYVVMSFVEGTDTLKHISSLIPDLHNQIHVILSLLEGIVCLHEIGIPHADLKPENILLEPTSSNCYGFQPVLIDFSSTFCNYQTFNESGDIQVVQLEDGTTKYLFGDLEVIFTPDEEGGESQRIKRTITTNEEGEVKLVDIGHDNESTGGWESRGYTPSWSQKQSDNTESLFDRDLFACAKLVDWIIDKHCSDNPDIEVSIVKSFSEWIVHDIHEYGTEGCVRSALDLYIFCQFIATVLSKDVLQYHPLFRALSPNPKLGKQLVHFAQTIEGCKHYPSRLTNNLDVFFGHIGYLPDKETLHTMLSQLEKHLDRLPWGVADITYFHNLAGFLFNTTNMDNAIINDMGPKDFAKDMALLALEHWRKLTTLEKTKNRNLGLNGFVFKLMNEESPEYCEKECCDCIKESNPNLLSEVEELDEGYAWIKQVKSKKWLPGSILFGINCTLVPKKIWSLAAITSMNRDGHYYDSTVCLAEILEEDCDLQKFQDEFIPGLVDGILALGFKVAGGMNKQAKEYFHREDYKMRRSLKENPEDDPEGKWSEYETEFLLQARIPETFWVQAFTNLH